MFPIRFLFPMLCFQTVNKSLIADFFRMGFTDADMESIRELFVNFDSNSDGTISNRELQHFINSIQGKPDE